VGEPLPQISAEVSKDLSGDRLLELKDTPNDAQRLAQVRDDVLLRDA